MAHIASVDYLEERGTVILHFSGAVRVDGSVTNPESYVIAGPSTVRVQTATMISSSSVALHTVGFEDGTYTVQVQGVVDSTGASVDPTPASFTSRTPAVYRSIFTHRGPIAKPPLVLYSGGDGEILTCDGKAKLPHSGAAFDSDLVGKYVRITSTENRGLFRIKSIVNSDTLYLDGAFEELETPFTWSLEDLRNGQIADSPSDVTVRINGVEVTPERVEGLLGQVVLPSVPQHGDDVKIDYAWVCNPKVEFRKINHPSFRVGGRGKRHPYRVVLSNPAHYKPTDIQATLPQPEKRQLTYRGYERAYSMLLNNPDRFRLNSRRHRIAKSKLERPLTQTFEAYEADAPPETKGWTRFGTGDVSVANGHLTVEDKFSGPYPVGNVVYWSHPVDLTFPNVIAHAWRVAVTANHTDGIFTGVASGFSDQDKAVVVGYLLDQGERKLGILTKDGWESVSFDWSILRSYRIFRDATGFVRVYVDEEVVDILHAAKDDLPYLKDLNAPFDRIEGVFFGSLSYEATNISTWDFVRYLVLPTNALQSEPALFVSYDGQTKPESSSQPWTPVGYHGTEWVQDGLLLDSWSASDAADVGLVGGDFRGFVRIEPLLSASASAILDFETSVRTLTHGISPNAAMAAVDDGKYLMQVSFLSDKAAPKFSYGGRSLPEDFGPTDWVSLAGADKASMVGRSLVIEDDGTGCVYATYDDSLMSSDERVISPGLDYILEARFRVDSYTAASDGFAGATFHAYDGLRSMGFMVCDNDEVALISDGTPVATFPYQWNDGDFHTYRLSKSTSGDLVTLFIDNSLVGFAAYSDFHAPSPPDDVGNLSFGSATASSVTSSKVEWAYCNAWRMLPNVRRYVGLWKGYDADSLLGYHLPIKVVEKGARANGNALAVADTSAIVVGDQLIVDVGPNRGVYTIQSVASDHVTVSPAFPLNAVVDYRVVKEHDWTQETKYRLYKTPTGAVVLYAGNELLVELAYNQMDLPASSKGILSVLSNGLPSIAFGAFDPANLSQTVWKSVKYAVARHVPGETNARHHVLNQQNVITSPEHLFTDIPHAHTNYRSSSTGIPPLDTPDFLERTDVSAFTQLNEGTPLVPLTQTYDVRRPLPTMRFVSATGRLDCRLNSKSFRTNDGRKEVRIIVPNDVLYNSLRVIERKEGEQGLLAPMDDDCQPMYGHFSYQNEVCLKYEGNELPETTPNSPTPWEFEAEDPTHVQRTANNGVLTMSTDATGTRAIYRNNTPLLDEQSMQSEAKFRVRLLNDSSGGVGDSNARFGISAPGFTVGLGFVTSPLGERMVVAYDLNARKVVGALYFDFLDGEYHTYRIVKNVATQSVDIFVDE